MSIPIRSIIRAKVNPNAIGQKFKVNNQGAEPTIYRGAGVDFWFLFVDDDGEPMVLDNVSDISILAKITTWQTLVTVLSSEEGAFNASCTIEDWNSGASAHVKISLLGSATNIEAGTYDLTLKAHTTDDAVDLDCFGVSTLKVLDVGLIDAAVSPAPDETIEGVVNSLLSGYLTAIGKAGQPRWEVSPNGQWRIAQTIDDNGQPSTLIEHV